MSSSVSASSATSDSSSTTSSGKCVMCGRETTLRCAKCAKSGTGYIFFCGLEHQELAWFAHKRVCGKTPFTWPLFTQREIDDMIELCDKPYRIDDIGPIRTVLDDDRPTINKFPGSLEEEQAFLKQNLRFIYSTFAENNTPVAPLLGFDQVQSLVGLRSQNYITRAFSTALPPSKKGSKALSKHFFDVLANKERNLLPSLSDNTGQYPFYSEFQHKFLFHCVSILLSNIHDPAPKLQTLCYYTTDEMRRFYREVVAKTHPKEAKILLDGLIKLP